MTDLAEKKCVPCEGGLPAMTEDEANILLGQINENWQLIDGKTIRRVFEFKGFNKTMGFVNAVAWIANKDMHHPDMEVSYNKCVVNFTTHAINGLSENDFICAKKVDKLLLG